ncbi:MAG: ABC transporter substrate-binding protein [Eubacteriales bacterium]
MRKQGIKMCALLFMVMLVMGCGAKEVSPIVEQDDVVEITQIESPEEIEVEVEEQDVSLTQDRAGNDIVVPENITSIISLAPAFTEVIIDLGLTDYLVAVDTNSAMLSGLPEGIIQVDMMSPDMEQLAILEPDILFASTLTTWEGTELFEPLLDMGVCVVEIPTSSSISAIQDDILFMGNVLSCTEGAVEIVFEMQSNIDAITQIAGTITNKKTVIFEIASSPDIYSMGSGTFIDEMITLVGATNAIGDQEGWISLSAESEVNANPDVILTNVNYIEDPVFEILTRSGYEEVTAIQESFVYYIDTNTSSVPNHNIVKALWEMAEAIYPESY